MRQTLIQDLIHVKANWSQKYKHENRLSGPPILARKFSVFGPDCFEYREYFRNFNQTCLLFAANCGLLGALLSISGPRLMAADAFFVWHWLPGLREPYLCHTLL
ncbi:hypothetical protein [Ruegeria sp. MALMAid1280]|uniref:hypothetical protein n=1 Tax=Ruegeria sp. MALMAid1280 TaxID=3411634 RepID=UPI003BA1B738